jgi:hypothetical protein
MISAKKNRYVKITAVTTLPNGEEVEWYAIDESRAKAKALADRMEMPSDCREYRDVYLTEAQYLEIPEW